MLTLLHQGQLVKSARTTRAVRQHCAECYKRRSETSCRRDAAQSGRMQMGTAVGVWTSMLRVAAREWPAFAACSLLKLLLMPAYKSTDFEVHRNWMAVTYNLPASQWYYDTTSRWTLDYPPLFAWFEWLLAQVAVHVHPDIVKLSAEPIDNAHVLAFQRGSVMVADAVLYFALCSYLGVIESERSRDADSTSRARLVFISILFNPGLLTVDHMHFQYNGLLIGILIAVLALFRARQHVQAVAMFSVLVWSKHLFAYLAPLYAAFLLRDYVMANNDDSLVGKGGTSQRANTTAVLQSSPWAARLLRTAAISLTAVLVSAVSLLPILGKDPWSDVMQLARRLVPFGRGLTHAYWAPNVWGAYLASDRALQFACRFLPRIGIHVGDSCAAQPVLLPASFIDVADPQAATLDTNQLRVLPQISPAVAQLCVVGAMAPLLVCVVRTPRPHRLALATCIAWLCAFMFGWHVHEKSVLYALTPAWLAIIDDAAVTPIVWILSAASHMALVPLIFTPIEQPTVALLMAVWSVWTWKALRVKDSSRPVFASASAAYVAGLVVVYGGYICQPWTLPGLPFLPLLLTSVYCFIGIAWLWLALYLHYAPGDHATT